MSSKDVEYHRVDRKGREDITKEGRPGIIARIPASSWDQRMPYRHNGHLVTRDILPPLGDDRS